MYFDIVFDDQAKVLFNGTPDDTVEWLLATSRESKPFRIIVGQTFEMVSIDKYLREFDASHK